jgi:hypothetical protein
VLARATRCLYELAKERSTLLAELRRNTYLIAVSLDLSASLAR